MKNYTIRRPGDRPSLGRVTVTVTEFERDWVGPERSLSPAASQKQRNHSPDGFEFGYGGSGPAQLALAILMDFTGKVPHPALYQGFKFKFIATMRGTGGVIEGKAIQAFMDEFETEMLFMPAGEKP